MQGGDFLIAAFGPFATALLHGWSESFGSGAVMHLAALKWPRFLCGLGPPADAMKADEMQSAASPA